MKVTTPICLLVFFFSQAASAQVLIGPTAGPQISWISFDRNSKEYNDTVSVSPHVGFHVGFNLSFRVRKRFFLHSSFLYSTKGRTLKGKLDPDLKDKVRYSYFEIPIVYTYELRTKIGPNKEFKWYFGAGPNISYWLGGKGTFYSNSLNENHGQTRDYKIVFNKDPQDVQENQLNVIEPNRIQLGLSLAAGVAFEPMGQQKFMLMFRYELGHSFFSQNDAAFPDDVEYRSIMRSRNNGLRISLSYLIDLKTEERKKGKSTIKKKKLR